MNTMLCYNISRDSVETQDPSHFLEFAKALSDHPHPDHCGALAVFFDGYNHDPRNLYEIEEVRTFVQTIDAAWPYIGYYGTTLDGANTLQVFGFCNTNITSWRSASHQQCGVYFDTPSFTMKWILPRIMLMNHIAEQAYGDSVFDAEGRETPFWAAREKLIYDRTFEIFKAFQIDPS